MANEVRLIDANALRKRMFSYYGCVNENSSKEYYRGETLMNYEVADMIEDCIDNAPTVDAVEVVRCKDCKYSSCNPVKLTYGCCHPSGLRGFVNEGFYFCFHGERRTE